MSLLKRLSVALVLRIDKFLGQNQSADIPTGLTHLHLWPGTRAGGLPSPQSLVRSTALAGEEVSVSRTNPGLWRVIAFFFGVATLLVPACASASDCVILLHGLARTEASMKKMAAALSGAGYQVVNVDYPSRAHTVERLAMAYVPGAVATCSKAQGKTHFVTHSMGGILVRYYLAHRQIEQLGKVVMLSPPNRGSEVVDKLRDWPGFSAFNGPAGQELGTDRNSVPNRLGSVDYPVGIITGNVSINPILSWLIPGADDGKVSTERAKLEGMTDFLVVPHSHPLTMNSDEVIRQTVFFLRDGRFNTRPPAAFLVANPEAAASGSKTTQKVPVDATDNPDPRRR